jgi:hypothetical protein
MNVNAVKERTRQMMRRFFEANQWVAEEDPDGSGFVLRFKDDPETGCATIYRFWTNENFFVLSSWNDRYISQEAWTRALTACNTWNADRGFGAYSWVRFNEEEKTAELRVATGGIQLPQDPDHIVEEEWLELLTLRWQICEEFWRVMHQQEQIAQYPA